MKAALLLMAKQRTALLKKTWWAMLLGSILLTATVYFLLPNKALHDWGQANPWLSFILQTIVYVSLVLSIIPMSVSVWKWMEGGRLQLWQAYRRAWRHLGGIVALCLLGSIVAVVAIGIVCIPALILMAAQTMSQLGALGGDALGLPSYFTPLLLLTLAAASFISLYISYWVHVSVAFLVASYRAQDMEKQQLAKV